MDCTSFSHEATFAARATTVIAVAWGTRISKIAAFVLARRTRKPKGTGAAVLKLVGWIVVPKPIQIFLVADAYASNKIAGAVRGRAVDVGIAERLARRAPRPCGVAKIFGAPRTLRLCGSDRTTKALVSAGVVVEDALRAAVKAIVEVWEDMDRLVAAGAINAVVSAIAHVTGVNDTEHGVIARGEGGR